MPLFRCKQSFANQVGTAGPAVRTNKHVTDVFLAKLRQGRMATYVRSPRRGDPASIFALISPGKGINLGFPIWFLAHDRRGLFFCNFAHFRFAS